MKILIITYFLIFAFNCFAFIPRNISGDSLLAYDETAVSFVTLSERALYYTEPPLSDEYLDLVYSENAEILCEKPDIETQLFGLDNSSYSQIRASGWSDNHSFGVFSGIETGPVNIITTYDQEYERYNDSSISLTDRDGGVQILADTRSYLPIGLDVKYRGHVEHFNSNTYFVDKRRGDSGKIGINYESDVGVSSKLSGRLGGIYTKYGDTNEDFANSIFFFDGGYSGFLLGPMLTAASFDIYQDKLKQNNTSDLSTLSGSVSISSSIPVNNWINFDLGFTRYMLSSGSLEARNYPNAALNLHFKNYIGLYAKYCPIYSLPDFNSLYIDTPLTNLSLQDFKDDRYFGFETGLMYHPSSSLGISISGYRYLSRAYPAKRNLENDLLLEYYDVGRVSSSGIVGEYYIHIVGPLNHFGEFNYITSGIESEDKRPIPYEPETKAKIGIGLKSSDSYDIALVVERPGNQRTMVDEYLPAYFLINATSKTKVYRYIDVIFNITNIANEEYEYIRNITGPGRRFALGVTLTI